AGSDAPRDKLKAQARKFVASKAFIGKPDGLRYQRELRLLAQRFDDHQQRDTVDPDDLTAAVQDAFGKPPAELVCMAQFEAEVTTLRDSILAIKFLPEEHRRPLHHLTQALRDLVLIQQLADDAHQVDTPERLRKYRKRSLVMPEGLTLGSVLKTATPDNSDAEDKRRKAFDEGLSRFKGILATVEELTRIDGQKLVQTPVKASKAVLPPKEMQPRAILKQAFDKGYSPDRKSTRLNSSHVKISYAVFCLKKK